LTRVLVRLMLALSVLPMSLVLPPARPAQATTLTFNNPASIAIPAVGSPNDSGPAAPYPSTIAVSGLVGPITKITVMLTGLSHTFPSDIGAMLVAPNGDSIVLMAVAGSNVSVSGVTLTFDDTAANSLPPFSQLTSGTYKPSDLVPFIYPAPSPERPNKTTLSGMTGIDPNGTWKLFVVDVGSGDVGSLSGGWSLTIAANRPPTAVSDSATVAEDSGPTVLPVLANDLNPDGVTLSVVTVTQPASGQALVAVGPGGTSVVYAAQANSCTTQPGGTPDTFMYTIAPGGSTATVSVTVSCVNDPPVNTVPGAQTTPGNTPLIFSAANGNAISLADSDVGGGTLHLTLGVSSGTLALGSTADLTVAGNGTASIVATGKLSSLNAGLQGLTFTPASGASGVVALTITTDDPGNGGDGGAQQAVATVAITVGALPSPTPTATATNSVTATATATVTTSVTATATVTATPTQTLAPAGVTPTATATPPPVTVSVSHAGKDRLQVSVTAHGTLQGVAWTPGPSFVVELTEGTPLPGGSLSLPPNSNRAVFYVRRVGNGAVTVPLTLSGSFGTWQTLVGGGSNAW